MEILSLIVLLAFVGIVSLLILANAIFLVKKHSYIMPQEMNRKDLSKAENGASLEGIYDKLSIHSVLHFFFSIVGMILVGIIYLPFKIFSVSETSKKLADAVKRNGGNIIYFETLAVIMFAIGLGCLLSLIYYYLAVYSIIFSAVILFVPIKLYNPIFLSFYIVFFNLTNFFRIEESVNFRKEYEGWKNLSRLSSFLIIFLIIVFPVVGLIGFFLYYFTDSKYLKMLNDPKLKEEERLMFLDYLEKNPEDKEHLSDYLIRLEVELRFKKRVNEIANLYSTIYYLICNLLLQLLLLFVLVHYYLCT